MYIDWLSIYQDHPGKQLPAIGKERAIYMDIYTGEIKNESITCLNKRGSFDSKISLRCDGSRISMSGNPSRWGQRDSLFGITSMHEAVYVFNKILAEFDLPPFTENTMLDRPINRQLQRSDRVCRNGSIITRVDIATNYFTGSVANARNMIEHLAAQRHQGYPGDVYPNGCTVEWKGRSKGGKGSRYCYPKYYIKYAAPGCDKSDMDYYNNLVNFCKDTGLIRHEVTLKSMLLKRHGLDSINAWNNEIMKHMSEKYMMHKDKDYAVNEFSKVSEALLALGETRCIAAKAQGMVDSWAAGNMYFLDNSVMSAATRYRYRKLIKAACGIDILDRINVTRLPIRVKTIELHEATPPEWYSRIAIIAGMASDGYDLTNVVPLRIKKV